MADSIPDPWICNYLIDVAEKHGGQLYNAPIYDKRKRVQVTEFLTFHEDSYIWAWVSDKSHCIPVRISREAVEDFSGRCGRPVVDCRFAIVFIKKFRPMFAPRPLGANQRGNTPISHIALDVGNVKLVGLGGHVFCDPKDVESDASVKKWVLGLREDGGGGNVLKLEKQEQQAPEIVQALPPQRPSSLTSHEQQGAQALEAAAVLPKAAMGGVNSIPLQSKPIDFKREHSKRWRVYEVDRWKFAYKSTQEAAAANLEARPTVVDTDPVQVPASSTIPLIPRTPSPESPKALVPQGTPSAWSPSQRGSSMQREESCASPPPHDAATNTCTDELQSDLEIEKPTEEAIEHDRSLRPYSPQPRTPAQRNERVSPNFLSPSSLLSNNPFPFPSSPTNPRKNMKRKIPPPEVLPMRDPNHSGPTQILVPNSDPSAVTSSQPQYSQASHSLTMSQTYSQSQSHVPPFRSSLSNEFKPGETSTPRTASELSHTNPPEGVSRMTSALISSQIGDGKAQGSADEPNTSHNVQALVDEDNQIHDRLHSSASLVSLPFLTAKTELRLEIEREPCERTVDVRLPTSDSPVAGEEEQSHSVRGSGELLEDGAETHAVFCQGLFSTPSPAEPVAANSSVVAGSQSPTSMHSLFSALSPAPGSKGGAPPVALTDEPSDVLPAPDFVAPPHDPEIWKNPSFLRSRKEGEEETSPMRVQKKHRLSGQHLPPKKKMKVNESFNLEDSSPLRSPAAKIRPRPPCQSEKSTEDMRGTDEGGTQRGAGKSTDKGRRSDRPPSPDLSTQSLISERDRSTKLPRLEGLTVGLKTVFHDSAHSHFRTTWGELQSILLRTGRIRTLGDEVVRDGSVYLNKD
ncbi:hypothetical protein BKA82DRAFT_996110 [Pisolithus tinctorius]|uniref:Telomere replication protein EST3 n=1 Tax=Pisolithus tinctorius Marx 270 TaxID=870435 RepID=A0A0C3JLX1_PISTI|nr:hypothetical protein BKA82DRAFT_996110 [Pisolithus tinctorius]KIO10163.1 hypothetical protein M404DRAFT_996110 [Pisolithus tinctorius Marx 270]